MSHQVSGGRRQVTRRTALLHLHHVLLLLVSLFLVVPVPPSVGAPQTSPVDAALLAPERPTDDAGALAAYGQLPLSFEANLGQADTSVDFVARPYGYTLSLSAAEVVLGLPEAAFVDSSGTSDVPPLTRVRVQLIGARPDPEAAGQEMLPGTANYLLGSDPSQWHTAIPTYARVAYASVYPGVDLAYYGNQSQLESDFIVSPGADASLIRLTFGGAQQIQLEDTGELLVRVAGGALREPAPTMYQDFPSGRARVQGGYVVYERNEVGFAISSFDTTRPLIIDPVLSYASYLGGTLEEEAHGIAVDATGSAYVTGLTTSTDFPTTAGAFRRTFSWGGCTSYSGRPSPRGDVYVTKVNSTGTAIVYSTYLGGSCFDDSADIAVDSAGNAYVVGHSGSPDFPITPGAYRPTLPQPQQDGFLAKLNPSGSSLVYSTFLGAFNGMSPVAVAVDPLGYAYATGSASDLATTPGAFRPTGNSGFVIKLNPTGAGVVYSTYLSDVGNTATAGLAVDAAGNAYVAGWSDSPEFPTTEGAFQRTGPGGFIAKLGQNGSRLVYATFLGTSGSIYSDGLAIDPTGAAYVAGATDSASVPTTPGAYQRSLRGGIDGFVMKLNPSGSALAYSTYLGGGGLDANTGIAVDKTGSAYLTGYTASADFPPVPPKPSPGALQVFVAKLSATGSDLVYSTYVAENMGSYGPSIAVDPRGNAYVTGTTGSVFPSLPTTPGAFQKLPGGGVADAFVARINPSPPDCRIAALLPGPPTQLQVSVRAEGGLARLVVTEATNVSVAVPTFAAGTTDTLRVMATKSDQTARSSITLQATDLAGGATRCDSALVTLRREPGIPRTVTLHHIPHGESNVMISNGTPGLRGVRLHVNGQRFDVNALGDGAIRTVNIAAAMRKAEQNAITLEALGPRGASATVLISDHV